jgi:CBS domain-containing protein
VTTAPPPIATPLVSLDAVVLDTETTGLDTKQARIVQIGAVEFNQGRDGDQTFDRLINPGVAIPERSTEFHGLSDDDVSDAPTFAAIAADLDAFIAGRIVIGHNIGFDLAVLKAEHERAGLKWQARRALDTRLLAQIAEPNLPDVSIEGLAGLLGVEATDRHTALGDARATAAIFKALIPRLRKRRIRTLGEAEAACIALTDVLDAHHRAGWVTPERREQAALSERALARIDAYPYRHRIREVMRTPPILVSSSTDMRAALKDMVERQVSSLFVAEDKRVQAANCGIVTERDFMRALAASGEAVLDTPVADHMQSPLETVPDEAFLYLAIGRMTRLKIRHLGVVDDEGWLVGALSQRDLLRLRADEAISLGDEILVAGNEAELATAWSHRSGMVSSLVSEGVSGREVAAVISRSLSSLTRQATRLAEGRMAEVGRGTPPASYAMLILGSGGRGESLLAPDQDNAIVYADVPEEKAEEVDAWFAELGRHVADILDAAGIPYCKGGVMASNTEWRGSLSTWKERVADWVRRQRPKDLLNVDIFFDLKAVYGDAALARELWHFAYDRGSQGTAFAKLLAELAEFSPPIGLFGRLRTENGRLDLKMSGLFPIVASARVLSIRHHVLERDTPARLQGVRALGRGGDTDLDRLLEIHGLFVDLMLDQQLADIARGIAPSGKIETSRLSRRRVAELKSALKDLGPMDQLVRDLLFSE